MSPRTIPERPRTHEMVVVHRVFRRESALLPRLILPLVADYLTVAEWDAVGRRRYAAACRALRGPLSAPEGGTGR
ncbi:hypothetical protein [Streptomyces erythrochromogenes]|uniref:hypothetical protein n=1 Tax=Streptomyces erythrochromogenes TaxID=285574 RepID=UPI0033ED75B4